MTHVRQTGPTKGSVHDMTQSYNQEFCSLFSDNPNLFGGATTVSDIDWISLF